MPEYRIVFLLLLAAVTALPVHARDGGLDNLRQTGEAFAAVARQVSPAKVFLQVGSTREKRELLLIRSGGRATRCRVELVNWPAGNSACD